MLQVQKDNKKSANSTYSHFWGIAKRLSTQIRKSAHACEALPNCSSGCSSFWRFSEYH